MKRSGLGRLFPWVLRRQNTSEIPSPPLGVEGIRSKDVRGHQTESGDLSKATQRIHSAKLLKRG